MSAVFATEQDYLNYDWAPADFGVPNPDQCAWDVTSYRVGFSDLPGWVQEWVETHGIPNGAIPADKETRTVTLTRSDLNLVVKWFEGTLSDHERHMDPNEAAHMREVVHKIKAEA